MKAKFETMKVTYVGQVNEVVQSGTPGPGCSPHPNGRKPGGVCDGASGWGGNRGNNNGRGTL